MDVALTAYTMVMLQENEDHRTSADTARVNITPVSAKEEDLHLVTPPAPVIPTLNPEAVPSESTATTVCASEMKTVLL